MINVFNCCSGEIIVSIGIFENIFVAVDKAIITDFGKYIDSLFSIWNDKSFVRQMFKLCGIVQERFVL